MIYPIHHLPDKIPVGVQTEQDVEDIGFDLRPWLTVFPDLVFTVWATRPGEQDAYPVNEQMLIGSVLYWHPDGYDTAIAGEGKVEIVGVGENRRKLSGFVPTTIHATSMGATKEPGENTVPWYEKIINAAMEIAADVDVGESGLFLIRAVGTEDYAPTVDRTIEEIRAAVAEGKTVFAIDKDGVVYAYVGDYSESANDEPVLKFFSRVEYSYGKLEYRGAEIRADNRLNRIGNARVKTPAPYALNIAGTTYDGSKAVEVEIPDVFVISIKEGVLDRTPAEIASAIDAARPCILVRWSGENALDKATVYTYSGRQKDKQGRAGYAFTASAHEEKNVGIQIPTVYVYDDGTFSAIVVTARTPNPYALTIKQNGVTSSYNGSNALTLDIAGGGGTVEVDATLTKANAAADAKAVGDRFTSLSEEKASSVNGFHPDSDGAVTIKYDRTTEKAYRHSGLSEYPKKITVYANDVYTTAPYIFMGKNYWPMTEQVAGKYTQHGLTFSTDKHSVTIEGTATTGSMFSLSPDGVSEYWEIPSDIAAGDQFHLYVFGKASDKYSYFAKVRVFDASKNYIKQVQSALDFGKTSYRSGVFEIPENAKYFAFQLAYSNGNTYDNTMFPVFVKVGTEVISDVTFADGSAECNTDNQTSDICSAPYECVVEYAQGLKEYIDHGASGVTLDLTTIHKDMSYVSPEMFGAYADGKHDDTVPIQACIDYAIANKKKVLGGNAYITNSPVIVDGNYHNIELGELYYSGTDSAVIVTGSYNNIRVGRIYADYGTCIRLVSDKQTTHNNLDVGFMRSQKNSVEYLRTNNNLYGNRLQFEYIKAGTGYNCIYQSPEIDTAGNYNLNLNNNNFIGGQLAGGEWGVYGAKGTDTYTTLQFEGVKNGIYFDGVGTSRVFSARYAELIQLAYDSTGKRNEGQGVLFKTESPFGNKIPFGMSKTMAVQLVPPNTQISLFNIDIASSPIESEDAQGVWPLPKIYPGAYVVNEKLRFTNGNVVSDSFMVYGRHILVKEPLFPMRKTVGINDVGYEGDYSVTGKEDELLIYSRFIVGASGCVYTLPPSYDMLAFNEFTVEQPEGTSCTFKDWRGTVIFDGVQYGAGTYKVCARIKDGVMWDYYDNRNQVWDIYKQDVLVATMPQTAN